MPEHAFRAGIIEVPVSMSRRPLSVENVTERVSLTVAESNLRSAAESIARARETLNRTIDAYWTAHAQVRIAARQVKP
jgi:hypothetical protein